MAPKRTGNLIQTSIDLILQHQAPSGAYIASPNFPTYHYCWFRDGAYIAYAMDLAGESASARRFHDWAAAVIDARTEVVTRALDKVTRGQDLEPADYLHTRYTLDGGEGEGEWPNFQLDGFGAWLWALEAHLASCRTPLPEAWRRTVAGVCDYLAALWQLPCYDCWEEFPDRVHPHTLAAIYAGLGAGTRLGAGDWSAARQAIRADLERRAVYDGYFVKSYDSYTVDASLLGLAVPYAVFPPDDPRIRATVERIETSLVRGGGVHRYPTDTYYGGGEWVLLAGWLGWHYVRSGDFERARLLLDWMTSQAGEEGCLPEQVSASLIDPNYLRPWEQRWGPSARTLLWSHAMYLILHTELVASRKPAG
jgi:GH15 family glucan-1,4-alpha-glucosidase